MSKDLILTIAILLIPIHVASAEIYECDGKWTNQPCKGKIGQTIKESPEQTADKVITLEEPPSASEAAPSATEPLAPRYDLVRKLKKASKEYETKNGIKLTKAEIDGFEDMCLDRSVSYADCLSDFNDKTRKLTELNQQQESNDLTAERNAIEAERNRARGIPQGSR